MDLNKIINKTIQESIKPPENEFKQATSDHEKNNFTCDHAPGDDLQNTPLKDLLRLQILTDDIKQEIYNRFKSDIDIYIKDYLSRSKDPNAQNGMIKCYLETFQDCCDEIGMYYFNKNKYLRDINHTNNIGANNGLVYNDNLLEIAMNLYEHYCSAFRKQFFIYDLTHFLGMNNDCIYHLNELRNDILKKAHTKQEGSMRTALASGRSNVTAMAILLNHDYDYTRTTQVIHTSGADCKTADKLPELHQTQHIVLEDKSPAIIDGFNDM